MYDVGREEGRRFSAVLQNAGDRDFDRGVLMRVSLEC